MNLQNTAVLVKSCGTRILSLIDIFPHSYLLVLVPKHEEFEIKGRKKYFFSSITSSHQSPMKEK